MQKKQQMKEGEQHQHQHQYLNQTSTSLPHPDQKLFKKTKHFFKCCQNNWGKYFCFDQCQTDAIVCQSKKCKCLKSHKRCSLVNIQSIMRGIEHKYFRVHKLQQCIQKKIDQIIDYISIQRDKIINQIRVISLSNQEQQFISDFQYFSNLTQQEKEQQKEKGKSSIPSIPLIPNLTGVAVIKLLNSKKKQAVDNIYLNIQKINKQISTLKDNVNLRFGNIELKSQISYLFDNQKINVFTDSQIIQTQEEKSNMMRMLSSNLNQERVLKVGKLYEAKGDKILKKQYLQACLNHKNMLFLIKNQHDKKIGGFTCQSLQHNFYSQAYWRNDSYGKKDFVFSLDLNQKWKHVSGVSISSPKKDYLAIFGIEEIDRCNLAIYQTSQEDDSQQEKQLKCYLKGGNNYQVINRSTKALIGCDKQQQGFTIKKLQIYEIFFQTREERLSKQTIQGCLTKVVQKEQNKNQSK